MTNFFRELFIFFDFKKIEKNYKYLFFNENEYTFSYLKDYILSKKNKSNIIVLTMENIENPYCKTIQIKNKFLLKILFLTLNCKYIYTTSTNLNNSIFLRSKVSRSKYIYLQHSPVSLSMIYDEKAFLYFDAIQAINKSQYNDVLDINKLYKKKIKPFKSKYKFFNKKNYFHGKKVDVLIAPTWHTDFYKLNIHEKLFKNFKNNNISFEFRPHPMSIKKNEFQLKDDKIKINQDKLIDFKKFKFLVSDWSGIFIEFSIINKTKSVLINTDKKILNKNYLNYSNMPIEISSRKIIGEEFETNKIDELTKYILAQKKDHDLSLIDNFYKENFY